MINFILDKIGEKRIISWIMNRVQFDTIGSQNNGTIREVFFRVPEFRTWLKQMQIRLLRNTLTNRDTAEQREGQILFIELLLANDVPSDKFKPDEVKPEEEKVIDKEGLLSRWNKETPKEDANNKGGSQGA